MRSNSELSLFLMQDCPPCWCWCIRAFLPRPTLTHFLRNGACAGEPGTEVPPFRKNPAIFCVLFNEIIRFCPYFNERNYPCSNAQNPFLSKYGPSEPFFQKASILQWKLKTPKWIFLDTFVSRELFPVKLQHVKIWMQMIHFSKKHRYYSGN